MNALTTIQALAFLELAALFRITEFAVHVKNKKALKGLLYDMTEMKYMFVLSQVCFSDELN
jgi:hypothetical protein